MLDCFSVADDFAKLESLGLKLPRGVHAAGFIWFGFFSLEKGIFFFF